MTVIAQDDHLTAGAWAACVLTYVFVYVQEDCCGVNYYTDWRNTKFGGRRIFAVPDTCCKTNEFGCGFKFETEDINRRVSFVLLIVV